MYRCDNCGKVTNPKEKQECFLQTREKTYENTRYVYDEKTNKNKRETFTTVGYETVQELHVCGDCFNSLGVE